jgi:hypothetical protein
MLFRFVLYDHYYQEARVVTMVTSSVELWWMYSNSERTIMGCVKRKPINMLFAYSLLTIRQKQNKNKTKQKGENKTFS